MDIETRGQAKKKNPNRAHKIIPIYCYIFIIILCVCVLLLLKEKRTTRIIIRLRRINCEINDFSGGVCTNDRHRILYEKYHFLFPLERALTQV